MRAITLKDMANELKLSVSTVSKALNNKIDIGEDTSQRIKKLAKDYNYTPNYSAITLRRQKTKTLAIIVPDITQSFYCKIVSSIQGLAFQNTYKLLILQSFCSNKKELACIDQINDGCVDGVIILSSNHLEQKPNLTIPSLFVSVKNKSQKCNNIDAIAEFYFNQVYRKIIKD